MAHHPEVVTTTVPPLPPTNRSSRVATGFAVRPAHLATLLRQVMRKHQASAVAVQVTSAWAGGDSLLVDDRTWTVVRADSELAIREALSNLEDESPDARLAILTRLGTTDLGWDVRARLARREVWTLESWELLRDLFRAHMVDPRVTRLSWLADHLLERAPIGGYPPAPSGVLDLDTAWFHALSGLLVLHTGAPDALTILRWSTGESVNRWSKLGAEIRVGIGTRFEETAGATGRMLARALDAGQGERLLALGLACDVLWPADGVVSGSLQESLVSARVRMEPLVGGATIPAAVARAWAGHARRILGQLAADRSAAEQTRAEELLRELRAEGAVVLSRVLPAGAAHRAANFGRSITAWLDGSGAMEAVESARARFAEHESVRDTQRAERAEMALRLARALAAGAIGAVDESPSSFSALVRQHVRAASWFDMARTSLLGGEPEGELSRAYRELLRLARDRREVDSQRFAERLAAWNTHPAADIDVVPVERALEQLVAPLADARPVLVVVVDGLDLVVWRQLHADLHARGWTWWQPEGASVAPVAIAMLPSVTSFSRASLFAGRPVSGAQGPEQQHFQVHPALVRSAVAGRRPVLFHKAALGGQSGLATSVRAAIGDPQQRVVGAVINAVDDWLDKSDQVTPRWSVAAIPLLDALLQEAAAATRAVVLLSDHGHLLEHATELVRYADGARWRFGTSAEAGEVLVRGSRVRDVCGHDAVVLAWSERLRYATKKTGYHGGASPQEVIAPIAVLTRDDLGIAGWRPVVEVAPVWWQVEVGGAVSHGAVDSMALLSPRPVLMQREALAFDAPSLTPAPFTGATRDAVPEWVDALLASPVYESQRRLAGRAAPQDAQMRALLAALDRFQGRAPRGAIAGALALPDIRVRGVLTGARRVLNVEGFAVLEVEEATGILMLNLDLLRVQFGLKE